MSVLEAIILGAVQGLTEFLPVSSSGHLVIVPELLGMDPPSLAFDVLLHLATLAAVLGYFAREVWKMILSFVAPSRLPRGEVKHWRRLALWVVLGTIPAALIGVVFGDFVESLFESTLAVGVFLLVTSLLLVAADLAAARAAAKPRDLARMGGIDALIVGLFQALALAPGISRSGSTISGGIFLGFSREDAARYSFLLSIPAIMGAGLLNVGEISRGFEGQTGAYVTGSFAALVAGVLAVHFMLRFLRHHPLRVFAIYTALVGLAVVVLSLV